MIKLLAIGIFLAGIFVRIASADFNQAKENYRAQFENYTKAHQEYLTARAKYQQFKTLPAETEAFLKMKVILAERAKAMSAYFALFSENLASFGTIPDQMRGEITGEINREHQYLAEFEKRAAGAKNLTEAENLSSEFQNKLEAWQNLSKKSTGITFSLSLAEIGEKSKNLIEKIEKALSEKSDIPNLNLREEEIAQAKTNLAQAQNAAFAGRNSFLQIKAGSKKFEVVRAENEGETNSSKAKTLLEQAVLQIREAARGF